MCFNVWLAKCLVMNGKPEEAWDVYLKKETASESFELLQLIANDCYRMGHFLFAARAFNVLESVDPADGDFFEGKRGACVGVFQQIIAAKQRQRSFQSTKHEDHIIEILSLLRGSQSNKTQAQRIVDTIRKGANDIGLYLHNQ
mmetsp:Transcript_45657/g.138736  ORF Transcript_45657/g.138736 Transcript_45657/m.138736 type:complete len:143 (+) Transcript_45657:222-650(+)